MARAALEAVCFQTKEILDAMNADSGIPLKELLVNGGMTANNLLMQLQADIIGLPTGKDTTETLYLSIFNNSLIRIIVLSPI